ncbi:MAG: flagellar hook assembly protein FlgD [Pseudomonadota bacterium]
MPTPILDLTSNIGATTPPTTLTRGGSAAMGKNEFLKLLVAQLANQDPTKPQDSSQFVAELAQFSALEQQQNPVSRLDTLLLGQATANQTSASSFIGKDVTYRGTGGVSSTASLPVPADKVTVAVADSTGRVVRTIQLGAHDAGDVAVNWDGRDDHGILVPAGDYTMAPAAFDADGKAVPVAVTSAGTVSGVAFEAGVPHLKVGGSLIKMSDVTSINERKTP